MRRVGDMNAGPCHVCICTTYMNANADTRGRKLVYGCLSLRRGVGDLALCRGSLCMALLQRKSIYFPVFSDHDRFMKKMGRGAPFIKTDGYPGQHFSCPVHFVHHISSF